MKRNFLVLVSVFLPGFFSVISSAQVDIPPGVARISLIQGDISTQRGDTGDWSAAALNQPVVGGDSISIGDGSKAELQLDHANILRLGNNAQAKIATVERAQIQVQIGQGLAYYTVFKDSEAEVEIDTPNAAIRPTSHEGVYRIEVKGFETQVIVRTGAVDISTPQSSSRVEMGQAATVRGTTDEAGNVLGGAPSKDSWDSWNDDRDRVIRSAQSWNHTNLYYVGSEDLDAYGGWVNVLDYGRVWSPTVASGWSPYRAGRWVWEPYWGWTWVSYEPWGWAPYHYGRWILQGNSWMWWPGPVESNYRPEWAPAYVSFFGFGGDRGTSVGFGLGSVGWLPIGPGDYFYPWYGQNGSHFKVVNLTDATNVTNINRGFGGVAPLYGGVHFSNVWLAATDVRIRKAILTLPANHFGTGHSAPTALGPKAFRNGLMMTGNLPIVPTRDTLSATNRPASPSSMMRGGRQDRFFTKRHPAPPQSLDIQAAQVEEGIQRDGQLVPVREVTQLDSAITAEPTPSNNGIERIALPTKDAHRIQTSRSQSERGLQTGASSRIPRPKSRLTHRMTTPAPWSHGARARIASKSGGSSHATSFSRDLPSKSTRKMTTLAAVPGGATPRAAEIYLNLANREMDKGNYAAAIASYKRAWQVDGNSTAARARLGRARRARQAENEIIANRR